MTDKELHRLKRDDLLQILLTQQRQLDEANAALEECRAALQRREIAVSEAGSIAEASLRLNGVFEAAQAAADQYAEQMRARADEAMAEAQRREDEARRVAEEVLSGARGEADRILRQARAEAESTRAEAERLLQEARVRTGAEPPSAPPEPQEDEGKRRRGLFRSRKS